MLLAIDVGNTRTKVYNLDRGGKVEVETSSIVDVESARKPLGIDRHSGIKIIGCSVVPRVATLIDEACKDTLGLKPVWIDGLSPLGLKIEYRTPETLGADRVANVLGALKIAQPPLIVVDLGTATKIEAVDSEGTYVGGSIMPSAQMGLKSLEAETAQLPEVSDDEPLPLIGQDTRSAILTGVMFGLRYGIEGLAKQYLTLMSLNTPLPRRASLVVTGGNARLVQPMAGLEVLREAQLTAIGLAEAAKRLGLAS